jgi:hypothetical protein
MQLATALARAYVLTRLAVVNARGRRLAAAPAAIPAPPQVSLAAQFTYELATAEVEPQESH